MRPKLETRLSELKTEYETGQKQVQQLEHQLLTLRETMLRISGAIMVLEEMLSASTPLTVVDQTHASEVSTRTESTASVA